MIRLLFIFIVFFSFNTLSKEYSNRGFNLKLSLPDNYVILDKVTIEEVQQNVENRVNDDILQKVISSDEQISVLYLVDEISLITRNDNIMDNISIGTMNYSLEELNESLMQDWCNQRLIDLGNSANREISKFECYLSDRIENSILTKYHQHENQYPNSFQAQYTNWFKPHKVIVITLTCHIETCDNHIDTFHDIVSSIEYYGTFDSLYENISTPINSNEEILAHIEELNTIMKEFTEFSILCNDDLTENGIMSWYMSNCRNYFNSVYLSLSDEEENKKLTAVSTYFEELKNDNTFSKDEEKKYNDLLISNNEIWEVIIAPLNTYKSFNE